MFHIGQQVVCVDDKFEPKARTVFDALPVRSRIYHVRNVYVSLVTGSPAINLDEIVGAPARTCPTRECGFFAARFRPVRKTNIDIFTAMLTPVKEAT